MFIIIFLFILYIISNIQLLNLIKYSLINHNTNYLLSHQIFSFLYLLLWLHYLYLLLLYLLLYYRSLHYRSTYSPLSLWR